MFIGKLTNSNSSKINSTISFRAKDDIEHFEGCLYGGAIGDAFGRVIEYSTIDKIKERFGKDGLQYIPKVDGKYKITDDTQMTLFTAEGLLKSLLKTGDLKKQPDYKDIYKSYLRWLDTQTKSYFDSDDKKGLTAVPEMYSVREPGKTCFVSLKNGIPGSIDSKINNSAGNGGIMRVAPIGLMYHFNPELSFKIGTKTAALTHSHPDAYLPAGFQAALIANIINDKTLKESIADTKEILQNYKDNEDTMNSIEKAESLSEDNNILPEDAIRNLGKGGKGNEALGIALYCTLKNPDSFKKAIAMSANHSGDSDTTAAITGNISGAYNGINSIKKNWVENIEMADWLSKMAKKMLEARKISNNVKDNLINSEKADERKDFDRLI